ncbi:hypothetical protein EV368DRAFT_84476 [Lentinula lateritia]|nr:hypothetical protein EV368DRAFT_84476 [Lentinula lateritia]
MTEYDYSPEGYQRYLDTQRRISKWVQNTNAHASEFRSPFGTFNPVRVSEESSSSRARTSTVSSKPHGDRKIVVRGRGIDDRERRHSMSATIFRQDPSGVSNAQSHTYRSPTPRVRHSYPYSPALRESDTATRTAYAAPTQSRRAQSLSSPPSQPRSRHRTHHHHHYTPSQSAAPSRPHRLDSPRRSTTPQQSMTNSHHTHSTHRPSSSDRSNHHHQHHSRSQSTPRPSSKLGSPLAVSPAYAVVGGRAYAPNPGGYLVIPPKGKKLSVIVGHSPGIP